MRKSAFFAVFDEEDEKDQKAWISCDGDCGRCTELKKKPTGHKVHMLKL